MYLIAFLLVTIAGIFDAFRDTLKNKYEQSIFAKCNRQFFDPKVSWRNKYKHRKPTNGAAFPFSKTALVFLTDAWHLFQFVFLTLLAIGVFLTPSISNNIIHNILFVICFSKFCIGLGFEIGERIALKR